MARTLGTIGVPSSAGAFAPGQEQAPAALRAAGLVSRLRDAGVSVTDHGDSAVWRWRPDRKRPRAQNLDVVTAQARATAARVKAVVTAGEIPLVLGGDCTIELGTVAGYLAAGERVGLVYVDKHADLNIPDCVPEGALDWMGMAHLLGEDGATPELSHFGPRFPLLADADIVLVGHRIERATSWERDVLSRRDLVTISDSTVASDPEGAATAALAALAPDHDRILVHFDVDVIDFTDAPLSEETGRNEGLTLNQAMRALRVLVAHSAFSALTVTELNPNHGEESGETLERFVSGLVEALAASPAGTAPLSRARERGWG